MQRCDLERIYTHFNKSAYKHFRNKNVGAFKGEIKTRVKSVNMIYIGYFAIVMFCGFVGSVLGVVLANCLK